MMRFLGWVAVAAVLRAIQGDLPPASRAAADAALPREKPVMIDAGALIDRMATRFGAFAVVAAVSYPMVTAADALRRAMHLDLPELVANRGAMWVSIVMGYFMAVVALGLGTSVVVPLFRWWNQVVASARLWLALALGMLMGLVCLAYLSLVAILVMTDVLKPLYTDLGGALRNAAVCTAQGIRGQDCQTVLDLCIAPQARGRDCGDIARDHLDSIRRPVDPQG